MAPPLLTIDGLKVAFTQGRNVQRAVNGISFEINEGETVALVGESGCGKSATSMSILRLLPPKIARVEGRIEFGGQDLLSASERTMREVRGNQISMIFQEPMTSLNPVKTVGTQVSEVLRLHKRVGRGKSRKMSLELLDLVGIPDPSSRFHEYPHHLSGGMRQRVMIAIALACDPKLLIADEPTTALDVTIQAQILDLMNDLKARTGTSILLVTHDLGVVAEMAQRVIVMYAGTKVEEGTVYDIFDSPQHPYTRGLLSALPRLGTSPAGTKEPLTEIRGNVPSGAMAFDGCPFAPRCSEKTDICDMRSPPIEMKRGGRAVACHNVQ